MVEDFGELALDRPLHLAIGMFDGVHLGHQAVLRSAVALARQRGHVAGVLTFSPHPSRLLRPQEPTLLILDDATKARLLGDQGVEVVIQKRFTPDFAQVQAQEFLGHIKAQLPTLASVHVGENFRFGKARGGDVPVLSASARELGVGCYSLPRLQYNGEAVSSSRVRACLAGGEIEPANAMLGYAYFSEGEVEGGQRLGREIGFPTLNLRWSPELRPRMGVYAVRASLDGGEPRPGVANYGVRPTVGESDAPRLEVHLLNGEVPPRVTRMRVEWLRFLRREMRFAGLEALRRQIARDVELAREQLSV